MAHTTEPLPPGYTRVRTRRRRKRRRPLRWLGLILLLLIVAGAVAVWLSLPALAAARDARTQLQVMENSGISAHQLPSPAQLRALSSHDARLLDDLNTVQGAWGWWRQPALFVSRLAPHLHAQLAQVDPLLAYGTLVARAGHLLGGALLPVLTVQRAGGGPRLGPALASKLLATRAPLLSAATLLDAANRARRRITPAALPSSVGAGLQRLDGVLPPAPAALRALAALPAALGMDRPRAYLVVPQNSEDLRASGGFIGTAGVLRVDHGRLSLLHFADSYSVDLGRRPNVDPPLPLGLHGWGAWYFRDANWSADFPTTARLLEVFYQLGTQRHVDGVIAFDSLLLPQLFSLTGPVPVPGYGETLTAANAFQRIDYRVNVVAKAGKSFAVAAYKATFARLLALPAHEDAGALSLARGATHSHDILLYANDPSVEAAIRTARADGSINSTSADYLYVVDTNTSTDKVNQLVHEQIAYHATIQPDRSIQATLTLSYRNDAGARTLPQQDGLPWYSDFVRVFVPAGSTLLKTTGLQEPWLTYTLHNKTQFSGYFELPSHATRVVTFHYLIPANADPAGAYALLVQKQPGTAALPLSIAVSGTGGVHLGGAALTLATTLDGDIAVAAPLSGGRAQPQPLLLGPAEPPVVSGSHPEPWVQVPTKSVAPF